MKRSLNREIFIVILLIFITFFVFRKVIFNDLVPIPLNYMVFEYEPFKSQIWPGYPLGVPHKAYGVDIFRSLYPFKELAVSLMAAGHWPLWNPYIFSGTPLLANFQTSVFYPLNLLYFIMPFLSAWIINIMIQPFLSGYFMYLFIRSLKVDRLGSILAASAFALMPFSIVWLEYGIFGHTLLWLPLILFAINKLFDSISWQSFFLITVSLSLAVLAGHPHPLFFVYLISILYFLLKLTDKTRFRTVQFLLFIFAVCFSLLLTSVQLLPTLELARQASVSNLTSAFIFEKFILPARHLVTFFVPDFFGNVSSYNFWGSFDYVETIGYFGIIPLIFALWAFLWRREKIVWFFFLLAMVSLSLAFPLPTTKLYLQLNLPIIGTNVPSRIFFITGFSFIVLAALGFDGWRQKLQQKYWHDQFILILIPISLVYLTASIFTIIGPAIVACPLNRPDCWQVALRNTLFYAVIFIITAGLIIFTSFKKRYRNVISLLLVMVNLFAGLYFADKFLAFSDKKFIFPETPVIAFLKEKSGINRYFGLNEANITRNLSVYYRIFTPEGFDPLYIKRYGQLIEAANTDGKIKQSVKRSDASLNTDYLADSLKEKPQRKRLLDLFGVLYLIDKIQDSSLKISDQEKFPPAEYQLVWEKDKYRIYQNKNVLPRIFLASQAIVEKGDQAILDKVFDPTFNLREKIILEEKLANNFILEAEQAGQVSLLSYQANRVELETNSLGNKMLFVSDVFYPGWHVYIDGKKDKIYRADFIFRAVALPKGKHRVLFVYESPSFYWGLRITTVSSVLLIIFLIILRKWQKEN